MAWLYEIIVLCYEYLAEGFGARDDETFGVEEPVVAD
jgi:hypothetical protein